MARLNEPPIAPQPSAETIDAGESDLDEDGMGWALMCCVQSNGDF